MKLCVVSAMLCASGAAARAQDADTRHGGWMGLGLGYGLARLTCDSCRGARQLDGWTFNLGLGGTPNPHVQVGVQGDFWLNGLHQGKLPTISTGTVLLAYYPSVSGSAFVEAGVGFSNYALEHGTGDAIEPVSDDYPSYSSGTGWGYTLGVGWHGMRVAYHYGTVGALRDAGGATVATGWKQQLVLVEFLGRVGPEPPTARVHAHARILNRAFPRPGMCPAAVTLFAAPSEVGKPYVEVAQISPSRSGSREPTPEQVDEAERNKAAELGANGVILNHIAGSREVLYDDALAIYVPADSARASAECGS
ncbi:MAG TPA: outer membrane beta-barrel protein [Gemmatimonadales bacterium]